MQKRFKVNLGQSSEARALMFLHCGTLRDDLGQAFVELALVLPVFILLLVGAAELGRLAYADIEVANAARAGVAYGAQNHVTASDTTGIQTAATNDAPDIIGLTAVATQTCTCTDGTVVTCANSGTKCIAPARIIESVQVSTSAAVNTVFHFPGIPSSLTLNGQAIMRVEQ